MGDFSFDWGNIGDSGGIGDFGVFDPTQGFMDPYANWSDFSPDTGYGNPLNMQFNQGYLPTGGGGQIWDYVDPSTWATPDQYYDPMTGAGGELVSAIGYDPNTGTMGGTQPVSDTNPSTGIGYYDPFTGRYVSPDNGQPLVDEYGNPTYVSLGLGHNQVPYDPSPLPEKLDENTGASDFSTTIFRPAPVPYDPSPLPTKLDPYPIPDMPYVYSPLPDKLEPPRTQNPRGTAKSTPVKGGGTSGGGTNPSAQQKKQNPLGSLLPLLAALGNKGGGGPGWPAAHPVVVGGNPVDSLFKIPLYKVDIPRSLGELLMGGR